MEECQPLGFRTVCVLGPPGPPWAPRLYSLAFAATAINSHIAHQIVLTQ